MIKNSQVIARIQQEVDILNENYAQFEKIKKFELLAKEWTIDNGELTPTLKLKRKIIKAKNEQLIEKMYEE